MKIYSTIPFRKDKNLLSAYNEHFDLLSKDDWLIINDMDTMYTSYDWYQIIERAINQVGSTAGIFTGYTNRVACGWQVIDECPKDDDYEKHRKFGENFSEGRDLIIDQTGNSLLSGFLMVIRKGYWDKIKGMIQTKRGCLGLDNEMHLITRDYIDHSGPTIDYRVYQIPVYLYHYYRGGKNYRWHLL